MTTTQKDIHSEDSVFRKLFTEVPRPRHLTQAERLARVFGETAPIENAADVRAAINVSYFLPRF